MLLIDVNILIYDVNDNKVDTNPSLSCMKGSRMVVTVWIFHIQLSDLVVETAQLLIFWSI